MGSIGDAQRSRRWRRWLVAVALVAAVASPALRDRDSFPLSTYPMYATARERTAVLATAVGVDPAGQRHRLAMAVIAGTDDPLIAESTVRDAIQQGRSPRLCRAVATRVGSRTDAVEVVEETHDVVRRAAGRPSLIGRRVHARCEVLP